MGACVEPRSAVGDVDVVVDRGSDPGGSSDPADPVVVDAVLAELDDEFDAMYAASGRRVGAAGDVVEGDGVDGDVLDPFGAGVLRTAQLRHVVQVVPGPARSTTGRSTRRRSRRTVNACWIRRRGRVLRCGGAPGEAAPLHVVGSLLRRRDACWRRGRRTRASNPKTRPDSDRTGTGSGRNAEVDFHGQKRSNDTHHPRPIPRPAVSASRTTPQRSCPTRGIC